MNTCEINKSRTNWGMVFFVLVVGTILLTNLFDYITWQIWDIGVYLVGGIFLVNILYKFLCNKGWAFKTFQITVFFLALAFLSHTTFAVVKPGYLSTQNMDLTPYEVYTTRLELQTEYYNQPITHKNLNITINEQEYTLRDSEETSYHFRTHPPRGDRQDLFIGHRMVNSDLEIKIDSTNHILSPVQRVLGQHPSVILGNPQIPMDIEIKTNLEGILNVDLRNQKVETLRGLLQGGEMNMRLSTDSLPNTKFIITVRGGENTLYLPKEMTHRIKYNAREAGELFIEGNQVTRRGEYQIISGAQENPQPVEINVDSGKIEIFAH